MDRNLHPASSAILFRIFLLVRIWILVPQCVKSMCNPALSIFQLAMSLIELTLTPNCSAIHSSSWSLVAVHLTLCASLMIRTTFPRFRRRTSRRWSAAFACPSMKSFPLTCGRSFSSNCLSSASMAFVTFSPFILMSGFSLTSAVPIDPTQNFTIFL